MGLRPLWPTCGESLLEIGQESGSFLFLLDFSALPSTTEPSVTLDHVSGMGLEDNVGRLLSGAPMVLIAMLRI